MNLVKVDVIRAQTAQGGFDGIHDVPARCADVVAARPHAAEGFGRDHDIFARDAGIDDGLRERFLGFAVGINVGRIHEVDAGVEGHFQELIDAVLIDARDGFPHALAGGEGHGPETDFRNEEAGLAKGVVFHVSFPFIVTRRPAPLRRLPPATVRNGTSARLP